MASRSKKAGGVIQVDSVAQIMAQWHRERPELGTRSATRDENGRYSLSVRGLLRSLKVSRAFGRLLRAM